jgi:hypothetical protein
MHRRDSNRKVASLLGGRPRRLTGAPSASIARLSLSRTAISKAAMCSVAISVMLAFCLSGTHPLWTSDDRGKYCLVVCPDDEARAEPDEFN